MKTKNKIRCILFFVLIVFIFLAQWWLRPLLYNLPQLIKANEVTAAAIFAVIYIVGTVCFLPGFALTLTGGFLFGPWVGSLINLMSATIGASISFLLARYLLSEWVTAKAGGTVKKVMDGINNEGWRFIAFVRLVPLFPFNVLNYALGLTPISFVAYVCTSLVCMAPAAFAYTYLGSLGKTALQGDTALFIKQIFLAIGLIVFVVFLSYCVKKYKRRIQN